MSEATIPDPVVPPTGAEEEDDRESGCGTDNETVASQPAEAPAEAEPRPRSRSRSRRAAARQTDGQTPAPSASVPISGKSHAGKGISASVPTSGKGHAGKGMNEAKGSVHSGKSTGGKGAMTQAVVQRAVVQRHDHETKTLLRKRPTTDRSADVFLDSHLCVPNGVEVVVIERGEAFSKVRAPGNEGYIQTHFLQTVDCSQRHSCYALVQRTDNVGRTYLRKTPTTDRANHVWVVSECCILDGKEVVVLKQEGDFTLVRTLEDEGFIQTKFLRS